MAVTINRHDVRRLIAGIHPVVFKPCKIDISISSWMWRTPSKDVSMVHSGYLIHKADDLELC